MGLLSQESMTTLHARIVFLLRRRAYTSCYLKVIYKVKNPFFLRSTIGYQFFHGGKVRKNRYPRRRHWRRLTSVAITSNLISEPEIRLRLHCSILNFKSVHSRDTWYCRETSWKKQHSKNERQNNKAEWMLTYSATAGTSLNRHLVQVRCAVWSVVVYFALFATCHTKLFAEA